MESFTTDQGVREPGLVELVERARKADAPVMTVEEVQRLGAIDPVDVQVDDVPWMTLENADDGPKICKIVQQIKVTKTHQRTLDHNPDLTLTLQTTTLQISDGDITELYGLRPTDRDRGMHLFSGGNVVSESVRMTTGKMRSTGQAVWVISGDVVASRRGRVYRVRVVFDQVS